MRLRRRVGVGGLGQPPIEVLGGDEHRRLRAFKRRDERLSRQPVRNRLRLSAGKAGHRPHVLGTEAALPAREGEGPRFRLVQVDAQLRLEQELPFREEFLLEESDLERLPGPVVADDWRHVA